MSRTRFIRPLMWQPRPELIELSPSLRIFEQRTAPGLERLLRRLYREIMDSHQSPRRYVATKEYRYHLTRLR